MIAEKYYESRVKGSSLFQLLEKRDNSLVCFFRDNITVVAEIVYPVHHEGWGSVKDGGEV
jgi:hypothetical protein